VSSSISNKRCGTAIFIKDNYKVTQVSRDDEGRFVQAIVDFDGDKLSFVSLYAPNKNPERNSFFSSISEMIDLTRPTFVCGDFNSVLDSNLDRKRCASFVGSSSAAHQESGQALQSLLSATQTFPVWRTFHPSQTAYSWTHGSGEFASRIDMVWAPTILRQSIRECEYYPSFFTDHQYLLVKCDLGDPFVRGPGVWKLNTSLLEDDEYCQLVRSFWSFWQTQEGSDTYSSGPDWWDQGKFYLREITRTYARCKAAEKCGRKSALTRQMTNLQRHFEAGDSSSFAQLCAVQEELRNIHLNEARGAQVRSRCRWAEEGEASTSFFLNLEEKHRSKQEVTSIRDPASGVVCHDPFEILDVWQRYYQGLFTAEQYDPASQDIMLDRVTRVLSAAESDACEGHLTMEECFAALSGMARGKTPGSDGFPMEFSLCFWQALGADLVRILNVAFESGQLSTSQRRGLIIVLYKKDDRLETKNWRPISLLNVDYKIARRAISGRLLQVMSTIVGTDQTCSEPGRSISENLFLVRD
jgi:exonuclease III